VQVGASGELAGEVFVGSIVIFDEGDFKCALAVPTAVFHGFVELSTRTNM